MTSKLRDVLASLVMTDSLTNTPIAKLLQYHSNALKNKDGFILLSPLTEPPKTLGIPTTVLKELTLPNNVDPTSVYGMLDRPTNLERPYPYDDDTRGSAAEKIGVLDFWNGHCWFRGEETVVDDHHHGRRKKNYELMIVSAHQHCLQIGFKLNVYANATECDWGIIVSVDFDKLLDKSQIHAVGTRALHRILRQLGWTLPGWAFLKFHALLTGRLRKRKDCRAELLDATILGTDACFNNFVPAMMRQESIYESMFIVGMTLHGMGRLVDAGRLFQEISNKTGDWKASLRAGTIFHCAMDCDKAIECFTQSLQAHHDRFVKGCWNFQEPNKDTQYLMEQILAFLADLMTYTVVKKRGMGPFEACPRLTMSVVLVSLLTQADFLPSYDDQAIVALLQDHREHFAHLLKNKYRNRKAATKVLAKAFCSGNEDGLQRVLFSTLKKLPLIYPAIRADFDPPLHNASHETFRKQTMEDVKDITYSNAMKGCANCKEREKNHKERRFLACPCQRAVYCSKTCQQAHWKHHRQGCLWYLEKKQNKVKTKNSA